MKWTPLIGINCYVEGKTLRQEIKDNFKRAMEEAETVSDEDLEAAAEHWDRLVKNVKEK